MKIVKFRGATMREALAKVKLELGSEAMVVATRQVRSGLLGTAIEVSAAIDVDEPAPLIRAPEPAMVSRPTPPPAQPAGEDLEQAIAPLASEVRYLRGVVKTLERGSSQRVRNELQAMREAIERLGSRPSTGPDVDLAELARRGTVAASSVGRNVVIVGPTGVGKTTTVAKLAARAALIEHRNVALITLDSYRVGAEAQIQTYAELIGIPCQLCRDAEEVASAMAEYADCDRVFVDTAGQNPRDRMAMRRLASSLEVLGDPEIHLAIATSTSAQQAADLAVRYAEVAPSRLLLTKVDEAICRRQLVEAPVRLGLPVSFITTGQAVPEDIESATAARLVELARSVEEAAA